MAKSSDVLKGALSRRREIDVSVTGRNSGRAVTLPIWFVFDEDTLYLLPVRGSDTQWYKNVRKNAAIRVKAGRAEADFRCVPVTDPAQVSAIVEKFRGKYGDSGVALYRKIDVAVVGESS
jgi:hypothetical protein